MELEHEVVSGEKKSRESIRRECEKLLHERLVDSNREFFLFEKGHGFVGFSEVLLEEKCFPDEDLPELCVKVISFYIDPSNRGEKLGSTFFQLLRHWGRDQKAALIEMEVPAHPIGANEFLLHQGLELVGTGARNCYRAFV